MTIIVKLKFVFSVLLVCCLFFPLSQCTTNEKQNNGTQSVKVIKNQYVFESPNDIDSWIKASALISPLVVFFITRKIRSKIKIAIGFLLTSGAALYIIFSITLFSEKILIGGYLAYTSSISLIGLTLIELLLSFRLYLKMKNNNKIMTST